MSSETLDSQSLNKQIKGTWEMEMENDGLHFKFKVSDGQQLINLNYLVSVQERMSPFR